METKMLHPHLETQIPSIEPRKRRLGIKIIPRVFGEERRIKKF